MRCDIALIRPVIDNNDALGIGQQATHTGFGHWFIGFDKDRFTMADKHRNPHTMRNKLNRRIQNLFGFRGHFPLFLGKTIIKEGVNMRDRVKGNLLGENFRLHRVMNVNTTGLVEQLIHGWLARTRHRLIGRHHHPAHAKGIMQRL